MWLERIVRTPQVPKAGASRFADALSLHRDTINAPYHSEEGEGPVSTKTNKMDTQAAVFETLSVPKALLAMALPVVVSQVASLVYNIVDVWCIGRSNNTSMVGASSLVLILYMLLVAIATLFGNGGSNLAARQLGAGDVEQARKTTSYSVCMGAIAGLAFSLLCLAIMNPLLQMLGARASTLDFARHYTFFGVVVGGVPIVLCIIMATVARGAGFSKEAGIGMTFCGLANIALDALLIFVIFPDGYQMLASGIAIMLSNVLTLAYFVFIYHRLRKTTVLGIPHRLEKLEPEAKKSLYAVGIPAALAMVLFNSLGVVLNRLVAPYGDSALAAVGIILKLERLPQQVGLGIIMGMVPLVAYNYSKKNFERMDRFYAATRMGILVIAACTTVLFFLFAKPIVGAFIADAETVRLGTALLRARSLAIPFMLLGFQVVYYMQGIGQGKHALLLTVTRHLLLSIPAMILFNRLYGMAGLIWAQPVADVINAAINYIVYLRIRRELDA